MHMKLWRARLCLAVMGALALMLLLSSCVPLMPHNSGGSGAHMDRKSLTITYSNNSTPIVLPMYPGTGSGRVSGRGGPFGSTTETETITGAPVADVVAFYQDNLAEKRPQITVDGPETQFKWRDQNTRLTLTVAPATGATQTVIKVHARR
ncbi:MAG: hypothetical protein ACYC63_06275 [Armatimonadota bacterium]